MFNPPKLPQKLQQKPGQPVQRSGATVPHALPRYTVQPPVRTGPGTQQIRVTAPGCVQPVASLELHRAERGRVVISSVFVQPEHRRHGVAKQMMESAMGVARREGFTVAQLEARPGPASIPAHSLVSMYRSMGFQSVGWSPHGGPRMERVLRHTPPVILPKFAPVPNRTPVSVQRQIAVGRPAVVQRADKYRFGFKASHASDSDQWTDSGDSTFLSMMYEPQDGTASLIPLGLAKSNKSATHGSEHAEDVALRIINDNLTLFSPIARNKLVLNISKSPCTSTARMNGMAVLPVTSNKVVGCTERLIHLVNNGITVLPLGTNYTFSLSIICRGLYCPTIPGSSQANVLAASQAAVNALKATGHISVTGDERPSASSNRYEVS